MHRKEDSATSLALDFHQAYSIVLVLFVSTLFSFGLSHCLSTYFTKRAIFLRLSWLIANLRQQISFLGLLIFPTLIF